jgi:beta-glucosidase/6-phospho-beta-glucosidase/beta-galactosidase
MTDTHQPYFPPNFVFGAATAAYQCEGETRTHGKGKVAWDDYLDEKGLFSADPASDFYHRYPEDLRLCHEYGINGIRISIAWSRIFPHGDDEKPNAEGVDFYHRLFAACRAQGVEPYVTLHHFDTPDALYREGDFLNRHTLDAYERYARFCFTEYPEVTHWFTFNEIWAVVSNMYIEGTWPRGQRYHLDLAFQAMHNMMVAHAGQCSLFMNSDTVAQSVWCMPFRPSTQIILLIPMIVRQHGLTTYSTISLCWKRPSRVPIPSRHSHASANFLSSLVAL